MPPSSPKLFAFLFTDIQGSTAKRSASPEAMRHAQHTHHEIIATQVRSHGGRLHLKRGEGDSTFSTFANASDALAAITAIQLELHIQEWPSEVSLCIRASLHIGTATRDKFGLQGSAIDRCARIRSVAHGGQTLLSNAAAEQCRERLPDAVELKRLGLFRLKDFPEPELLFQLHHPDLPKDFPPLNTPDERVRIPPEKTPFIGRATEVIALTQALNTSSLVTVVGSGGSGKTRLALHTAREVASQFPDGVATIELAQLTESAQMLDAVIKQCFPFSSQDLLSLATAEEKQKVLLTQLHSSQLLLIFDNAEHVAVDCSELITRLQLECPTLKFLVTSQHMLGMSFETPFVLNPMLVPDERTVTRQNAQSLLRYDAIELFVSYAQRKGAKFVLSEETKETIASVCRHLHGLPLALELVAAQCAALSLQEGTESLFQDYFATATDGPQDGLPRHRTLRDTIHWSYHLLTAAEQAILQRLTLFEQGWTLQAAWDICQMPGMSRMDFQNLLKSLAQKSLVSLNETEGGSGRFMLLQPIALYLQELSNNKSAERDALRETHSRWYQTLAQNASPHLEGEQPRVWLDTLEQDHANLRQGLQVAVEQGRIGDALAMATALCPFWVVRGYCREGWVHLQQLLEHPDTASCGTLKHEGHMAAATLCFHLGQYDKAREYAETVNEDAGKAPNPSQTTSALRLLGDIAYAQQRYDEAATLQTEALSLSRSTNDFKNEAVILNNLGNIAALQQHWETASEHYRLSRDVAYQTGQKTLAIQVIHNQAMIAFEQGDPPSAGMHFAEAYHLASEVEDLSTLPILLYNFSEAALRMNKLPEARALALESLFGFEALGDKRGFRYALVGYATTLALEAAPVSSGYSGTALVPINVSLLQSAAELFGIAEALDEQMGVSESGLHQGQTHTLIERITQILGDARMQSVWNAGKSTSAHELKPVLYLVKKKMQTSDSKLPEIDGETAVVRMLASASESANDNILDVTWQPASSVTSG